MDKRKSVTISYDPKNNIVYIQAKQSDFVPKYLEYLLEYLEVPKTAKIIFTIS